MRDDETDASADGRASADGSASAGGNADDLRGPQPEPIEASAPESFGALQVWWGDGKGKTTAALGTAIRAAGHGYRVHVLQFMKGGAGSVEDVRGEYNAVAALPGLTCEHAGHYGWHRGRTEGEADHAAEARAGLERARDLIEASAAADLRDPIPLDAPPIDGVHALVLDEIGYAANRELVDPDVVSDLLRSRPDDLEVLATGGHERPTCLTDHADVVTEVGKERHHFDDGVPARQGTEF